MASVVTPTSSGVIGLPLDVSNLVAGEEHALQMLHENAPREVVFEVLVRTLEGAFGRTVVGSLMVLDPTGTHLCHGAAPSLPDIYNRVVDKIPIGSYGTCCAAAYRNEIVITPDIEHDPSWAKLKDYPLAIRLRAAWSHPIRSATGAVLGTLGTYFRECRAPTEVERAVVGMLARTAALAIERPALVATAA